MRRQFDVAHRLLASHLYGLCVDKTLEEESDVVAALIDFGHVDRVGEEVGRRKFEHAREHGVFREENAATEEADDAMFKQNRINLFRT